MVNGGRDIVILVKRSLYSFSIQLKHSRMHTIQPVPIAKNIDNDPDPI